MSPIQLSTVSITPLDLYYVFIHRYYIISQLTALYALDDSIITNEERTTASRLYGPRRRSFSTSTTLKSTKQVNNIIHYVILYSRVKIFVNIFDILS